MAKVIFRKKIGRHQLILECIWGKFHKEYRLRLVEPLLREVKNG